MAKIFANLTSKTILIYLITLSIEVHGKKDVFSTSLSSKSLALKQEKFIHLHFYLHDILSGRTPSAIQIAKVLSSNTTSKYSFGTVFMTDDPLTITPEPRSKLVGKAQGIYAVASQGEIALLVVMDLNFVDGKYNGSTLNLIGRNAVLSKVREIPIIGGSGVFRFARGYAKAVTHSFDINSGDAVVEYDVYVFHY